MKKKYSSRSFLFAMFLLLLLPAVAGCSDDNAPQINTLTTGLQQVVSDLDEITARLRSTNDGSAATTAKIGVLETALNNVKADIVALLAGSEISVEHLGIILGKLQGLQFGATDIDRTVTNFNRLIAGIPGGGADIDKVVNYVSKISELEAQSLILTRFLEHGLDEGTRREIEARIRAGFQGDIDTLEVHIKRMTDASVNQMKSEFEPLIAQLQSARYVVLESVVRAEKEVPALSQALSLLTGRIADLDARLTREQIISIVETTVNETLQANGITPDRLNELAAKIAEIDPLLVTLNALLPGVDTLITEITLVKRAANTIKVDLSFTPPVFGSEYMGYFTGRQPRPKEFPFPPPPYTRAILFVYEKNTPISKKTAEMIVQIKPANARFDRSMVSLIDKQGNTAVNKIVEITGVTPYVDIDAHDATHNTGLYVVSFRLTPAATTMELRKVALISPLKGYDPPNETMVVLQGGNQQTFALVVKTNGIAANRPVSSTMDIIITSRTSRPYVALDGARVNGFFAIPRALNFSITSREGRREIDRNIKASVDALRQEYVWCYEFGDFAAYPFHFENDLSLDRSDNNRKHAAPFDVAINDPFQVNLYSMVKDNTVSNIGNAYGYYIALDTINVNPVKIDDFEGIGKLYTISETGTVKRLTNRGGKGEVGFRIWAVNYDGTFVDPDGRGFVINYQ